MKPLITSFLKLDNLPNLPQKGRVWRICYDLPIWTRITGSTSGLRVSSTAHGVSADDPMSMIHAMVVFIFRPSVSNLNFFLANDEIDDGSECPWGHHTFAAEIRLMSRRFQPESRECPGEDVLWDHIIEDMSDAAGFANLTHDDDEISYKAWSCQTDSFASAKREVKKALSLIEANFETCMDVADPVSGKTGWQLLEVGHASNIT